MGFRRFRSIFLTKKLITIASYGWGSPDGSSDADCAMIHDVIVSIQVAIKNTDNTDVDIITGSFYSRLYSLKMFSWQLPIGY